MSHIWVFSPISKPLLQQCIEAALLQESDNEWTRYFGRKQILHITESNTKTDKPIEIQPEIIEITPSLAEQKNTDVTTTFDEFFECPGSEIRNDIIIKECLKTPDLFQKMAHKLDINTVEKLFDHVFASKDIENSFLTGLIYKFLPLYIKLQYSRQCVDLLTKTKEKYPEMFQKLLRILIEDTAIPNQALSNYISTFDEQNLTIFMENLSNIEISSESFVHNILMIYTAYKDCNKTEKIQRYIEKNLLQHSKICMADKNYGRLFLAYLQNEKLTKHRISKQLADCLEMHHSVFKRPCIMLLKDLL